VSAGTATGPLRATNDGFRNIMSLLMVFTISRIHQHFPILAPFRPLMLLTLLGAFYALANPRFLSKDYAIKTWSFKITMAMGIMACISVPLGISMGASGMFILSEYSKVILFGVLVLFAVRHTNDLYRMVWSFVIAGGCMAYLGIFVYKMKGTTGDPFVRIQSGYSYDSNDLALVCVLCIVMALLTFTTSGKRGKLVSLGVLAALGMTLAKTGSRGGFLAMVVVVAALLVMLRGVSLDKKLAFVAVVGLGLLVAAPPGYWEKMASITSPKEDYNWTSETGRKAVFERGMGYMLSRPLGGLGINNFGRAEGTISARAQAREFDPTLPGIKWSVAHNSFVQAGAEMGIPGMVIFSMLIFGTILQCTRLRKHMPPSWAKGDPEQRFLLAASMYLPIALIGFAVGGFFVSFAYLDPVYVLVSFVGGLQLSYADRARRDAAIAASGSASVVPIASPTRRYRGGLPPSAGKESALPPPVLHLHPR
jgi:O-antigen ligase